ncbi:hypothetical protein MVEN_01427000 [Mycena venus]|uniref:Zn(2)-C6 fungal-type domain-containing protein n=1 Tax=Mycena venus TaxID=2733690 RepID=A0A8H6XVP0_9AGAR|nr:hypothetical protein MVEN_01427000 [Mycena venus]
MATIEAKLKTPTCNRCKLRKIRCDGAEPCFSCSTAAASCQYEAKAKESRFGFELRKGQACLACRRKKKRCDGQLPCRTCSSGRKKTACEYPDGAFVALPPNNHKSDSGTAVHTADSDTAMRSSHSPSPEATSQGSPAHASPNSNSSDSDTMVASGSGSSTGGSPAQLLLSVAASTPSSGVDVDMDILDPSPFTLPDLPSDSELQNYTTLAELSQARDSFLDTTGKRNLAPPEIPSDTGEQCNYDGVIVARRHLSLKFAPSILPSRPPDPDATKRYGGISRDLFIAHRIQLGLSVPDATLAAIDSGTHDHDALHPALLHASQLMGYMLARHLLRRACMCRPGHADREAEQMRFTFCALRKAEMGACEPRPVATLQTLALLSLYFFNVGDIARGRELILAGNAIVREHNLDAFSDDEQRQRPTTGGCGGFNLRPTNDAGETQAAVAQLVYLDLLYAITLKLPSIIDPVLRENFRNLVSRPNAHAEINYARAKSAFLMYETQRLTVEWARQPGLTEAQITEWQATYWTVTEALDTHRSLLTLTLTKLAFCPVMRALGLALKVSSVLCLTGSAALLSLFSADHPELRQKKYAAIGEIISISSVFSDEDCEQLDPILSACWTAIIGTLDQCIALGPETIAHSMHDLPSMASMMRQRNKTLQQVTPFPVDI